MKIDDTRYYAKSGPLILLLYFLIMYDSWYAVAHHVVVGRVLVQCDYDSWVSSFVSFARRVPLLISLFLSITGYATSQPIFAFLGWAITYVHLIMYPFKFYFNIPRADPFCPAIFTWAFPNDEMVYMGIIVTFVIGYSILWKHNRSIFQWIILALFFLGPTVVLLWLDKAPWWHLVVSFLIGLVSAIFLLGWIWFYEDSFIVLFNLWPFSIMYHDTILIRENYAKRKFLAIKKCIEDYAHWQHSHGSSPQVFSTLSSRYGATKYP